MSEKMRLQTLDESDDARDDLTLSALQAAGRGAGPHAERCRQAFSAYENAINAGQPKAVAKASAKAALMGAD